MSINLFGVEKRKIEVAVDEYEIFKRMMIFLNLYKYIQIDSNGGYRIENGELVEWRENYFSGNDEVRIIRDKKIVERYNVAVTLKNMFLEEMKRNRNTN